MTQQRPPIFERLEPGLRRVIANNPSAMTYWGTNTYIVGEGKVALIDPGPLCAQHFQAVLAALKPGETIESIFVTHSHRDHSQLARPFSEHANAPVFALGDSLAGRSPLMARLADCGLDCGGEGVDSTFQPDELIGDLDIIDGPDWQLRVMWTPGHFGNHLVFGWQDALFTGDHVMGWASSLVSPPDGDLAAFMASTKRLAKRDDRIFYPGHGAPVTTPKDRLHWLIGHRQLRNAQILSAMTAGPMDIPAITRAVYQDLAPGLIPAAHRNVFAHLIDLVDTFQVAVEPQLDQSARYSLIQAA